MMTSVFRHLFLLSAVFVTSAVVAQSRPAAASPQTAPLTLLDRIVMVVNGSPITQSEIERRKRLYRSLLELQKQPIPSDLQVTQQVTEKAILDTAILLMARETKQMPTADIVTEAVENFASRNNMSMAAFEAQLLRRGITMAEYRRDMSNEIALERVRIREVDSKVQVTESEVDRFLRDPETGVRAEYQLQHLIIRKEGRDIATARQLAAQLKTRSAKEDFTALVKSHSDAPDKADGGVISYRLIDKLPQIYQLATDQLTVGETSELLESGAGFHLIKLTGKRLVGPEVNYTDVRHILIRDDPQRSAADTKNLIDQISAALVRDPVQFPMLAQQHSQDGTAAKGGDLGWAFPGQMVPEFEKVMNDSAIGRISAPFRTQFGWHVLQVKARKVEPMQREMMRTQAGNMLKQNKLAEHTQQWLAKIRSQAFVQVIE